MYSILYSIAMAIAISTAIWLNFKEPEIEDNETAIYRVVFSFLRIVAFYNFTFKSLPRYDMLRERRVVEMGMLGKAWEYCSGLTVLEVTIKVAVAISVFPYCAWYRPAK